MQAMRTRNCRWTSRDLLVVMLLSAACGACPAAEPNHPIDPGDHLQERLLQVDINRQQLDETVMLLENASGQLYVAGLDLTRWRVRLPPQAQALRYQSEAFFALEALDGVRHTYHPQTLTLDIEVAAQAFEATTRQSEATPLPAPPRPEPGGFLNYEWLAANSGTSRQRSGQFELGVFNAWGVGITSWLVNELGNRPSLTRLDTTWTHDAPDRRETWRVGDAISSAGSWGRSVRFGGIQFSTNFATQPGFATFAPQSVVGQAVLPSTVDVFVNNALVSRQTVPPGPFSIGNLPVVSGAGEVRLVVRDMLGREQLVSQPFYASQSLLRQGLSSFSYEAGYVRTDFGQHSDRYGPWLATGSFRHGVSDRLTAEVHAQAMRTLVTAGLGGDYLLAPLGTVSAYLAGSHRPMAQGHLAQLGLDHLTPTWGLGAQMQNTSSGFAQVGDDALHPGPTRSRSANLSHTLGGNGSVGLAWITQSRPQQPDVRLFSLNYGVGIGGSATLNVSALANLSADRSTQLAIMFSMPLGAGVSLDARAQPVHRHGSGTQTDLSATVQRNLPGGSGYGYRLQQRNTPSTEGMLSLQNDVGSYTLGIYQDPHTTATQLSASGGLALLGGRVFASRRIDQSFAVVTVPGYPGVPVYADNQPAGHTDANGQALIPRLRAYDRNAISILQRDLPMDAQIDALSMNATPYYRSGIAVTLPIRHAHAATFTVVLDDGSPLPPDAILTLQGGRPDQALLGSAGEVYASGLMASNALHAQWQGQHCDFTVAYAPASDPLPDLGTFVCTGMRP